VCAIKEQKYRRIAFTIDSGSESAFFPPIDPMLDAAAQNLHYAVSLFVNLGFLNYAFFTGPRSLGKGCPLMLNNGKTSCLILCTILTLAFAMVTTGHTADKNQPSEGQPGGGMSLGQAIVLGVVEGVTEYLPVSSTGHLLLAEHAMGMDGSGSKPSPERSDAKDAVDAYTICIQAGAIIAVLWLYFPRIRRMLRGVMGKDPGGFSMLLNIVVAFLPAAVIGLLFNRLIKSYLFGPWPVVAALFVGGLAIFVLERWREARGARGEKGLPLDRLTWVAALIIGFAQCLAMWPGVSRSLATIAGGVLVGLSMSAAVEFSFLLGMVTLGAATGYDALKHGKVMLQSFDGLSMTVGLAVAFISAVVSVKWLVAYLNRHGLAVFGYYRIALALLVAALIVWKVL
jgi:undecaprenyl-diphosphatase